MDDLARFCCHNPDCTLYGWRNAGNLSVCGRIGKHKQFRQFYCNACRARFSERKGTALYRCRLPEETPSPSSTTWPRATASDRPDASSAFNPTPWSDWPASPAGMPTMLTTSSWLFPPRTCEVQFDEKWSFVAKKQNELRSRQPGR